MWAMFPEICEPDFEYLLVTITAMYGGSGPLGGGVLLPGSVLHMAPQVGLVGLRAKPLKLACEPEDVMLIFYHCAPQKVTEVPMALSLSPMANDPPPGAKANTLRGSELHVLVTGLLLPSPL